MTDQDLRTTRASAALPSGRTRVLGFAFGAAALMTAALSIAEESKQRPLSSEAASLTKMTFRADEDMLDVLNTLLTLKPKAIEKLTPAEARMEPTVADAVNKYLSGKGKPTAPEVLVPGVTSKDISIATSAGALPARVFTPAGAGPFPVVVYFHGGGFVFADRKVYDAGARGLSKQANAAVVSVDYRLAPENKFPAAHDDALAAYQWVGKNAATLNGDPKKLALAGESAGGNLALATALASAKAGGTQPLHVLAVYPVTQPTTTTESYEKYRDAKPLNRPMMLWFFKHYTRSPADGKDPRLDLVAADLKGLPPVTIINAEIDPLRDDGKLMADALTRAGVPVERKLYEGVTHEFFGTAAVVPKAKDAQAYAGQRLMAALGK